MKVKAYALVVVITLFIVSAATKDVRPVEGLFPGDRVPGITLSGSENGFQNHSGRYTLLNFWAAYDATSRAQNVRLANVIEKLGSGKVSLCSVSLDQKESIFLGTMRIDKLDETTQFHANESERPEVFRKYNLGKGFRNFLINDKGVIVATNVSPEKLAEILERV